MRRIGKINILLIWMFLLVGVFVAPVYASEGMYQIVIEDDADLLTSSEEQELRKVMEKIAVYGNVAFKSIDYNSSSTSVYIQQYYRKTFGISSGTVFLIDMDNREIYIYSDGTIYNTITNSYAEIITDNVYTYASDGDYFTCSYKAFKQMAELLGGGKIAQPMKHINNLLIALVISLLINYIIVQMTSTTKKVSSQDLLSGVSLWQLIDDINVVHIRTDKKYSPQSSSSGGGGGGGGGGSGGGGGHGF